MNLWDISKLAASMAEKAHQGEGFLGPGVPSRKITPLPTVKEPKKWEFSAHPHLAEKAGPHIDLRLGDPTTGIAHSFVLPKRTTLPGPGEMTRVIPTFDHTIPYMDYFGDISSKYGKGVVKKGRRTAAEVYHADPTDGPGTKIRFNLYEGPNPEEFSIRRDQQGKWFLHNKTQTRTGRPDIPGSKPSYKEIDPDEVDVTDETQAMMPKLDGAHGILDLQAGRAPRLFSYREAKVSTTGLIEHTHKLPELLKTKVPKELDDTLMRCEILGIKDGKAIPAEVIGGLLNTKVWDSRKKQQAEGIELQVFPFNVIQHKGKSFEDVPYSQHLDVLKKVEKTFKPAWVPEIATTSAEKLELLNKIRAKKHPLTEEGVVLVSPNSSGVPIKAKFAPDFDVFVKAIHPAVSGKTGKEHDRAGSISYSWTPDGPVVGQLGGFSHDEARDMLKNPDQYIGRVAKAKAMRVFKDEKGELGALFQPRFKGWHLDKGDIEKQGASPGSTMKKVALSSSLKGTLLGGGIGALGGGIGGYFADTDASQKKRLQNALMLGGVGGLTGAAIGFGHGLDADSEREWAESQKRWQAERDAERAARRARWAKQDAEWDEAANARYDDWSRRWKKAKDDYRKATGEDFNWDFHGRSSPHEEQYSTGDRQSRRAAYESRSTKPPTWVGSPKTKAEAKSAYRREVKKNHPDLGGREEKMKNINSEWDRYEKSDHFNKLAFAFFDELEKIAAEMQS
jgi:hypothetical protein